MKNLILLLAAMVFHVSVMLAQTTTENKELRFQNSGSNNTLLISNMNGAIEVESHSGNTVLLEIKKTIKAKNSNDYQRALKEVKAKITTRGDSILVQFDPPCTPYDGNHGWNSWSNNGKRRYSWNSCYWEPNFEFRLDYKVKVPKQLNLNIRTKDDGDVRIKNVSGNIEASNHHYSVYLENVSGEIDAHSHHGTVTLENVSGGVNAHTHHKDISVSYAQAPQKDGSFSTHHGDINVSSKSTIAAKMTFKSRHGDFFTNIDNLKRLPALIKEDRKSGKDGKGVSYKVGAKSALQARNGSIVLDFKTYHGDVTVKEKS